METAPLKSFATWARTALIREVSARISVVLASEALRQEQPNAVAALEKAVSAAGGGDKGRDTVADKVAYTWFNRIIALRFMDANGYTGIGVVSPERGREGGQPEVLAEAKRGNIDSTVVTNKRAVETVTSLLNGVRRSDDPQGEAYALLLAEYCRHWNRSMPFMFEREGDYTELLIPANLLADGSVLARAVDVLTEGVCQDVEVIGWLYQFYIAERKDEVFAGFKKNKKAGAAEIPAATQLFTPHWIVRYLVENSLGRLWLLNRPTSRLADQMDYYVAPVDEETDYLKVSGPEELKVIDPACGSGHMLTYAFDLLYSIYEEEGYAPSDIPALILTNNLYGTEIDPRAGALAAFALMMKARARQRIFFLKQIVEPKICVLEPVSFARTELGLLFTSGGNNREEEDFWNQFEHADTFGSLVRPREDLIEPLRAQLNLRDDTMTLFEGDIVDRARVVLRQAEYLSTRYHVVVANPPYMGTGNMGAKLAEFAKREYPSYKGDLFAMFIRRCMSIAMPGAEIGMITMHSWMFLAVFETVRMDILRESAITTLVHLGTRAFDSIGGAVVATAAFTLKRSRLENELPGTFIRVVKEPSESAKNDALLRAVRGTLSENVYVLAASEFHEMPGSPIAYWLRNELRETFRTLPALREGATAAVGLQTSDNSRFLRSWFEVSRNRIALGVGSREESANSRARWFPYNKGGAARRWYGNQEYVVDWERDGHAMFEYATALYKSPTRTIKNLKYYFRESTTWSKISSGRPAFRFMPKGSIFDVAGASIFRTGSLDLLSILGILNSKLMSELLQAISPTLNYEVSHVASLPIKGELGPLAIRRVERLIEVAKLDWDSFETSWDFQGNPIVQLFTPLTPLADLLNSYSREWSDLTIEARQLEAENNAAVSKLYAIENVRFEEPGLDELTLNMNVDFRYSALAQDQREQAFRTDSVKDLVSYAVGCMLGRFSLDVPALVLANQGDTLEDYLTQVPNPTFTPDADNVIPIVDGDWFEDDIVARFRQFLRVAFGTEHFEDNLRFITEALGVKDLRDYFVKSFYKDHVQRYKKRPIYWLFSSPKGSFNALIYMHRYTASTVSTVLNEYLREYRAKLDASRQHHERLAAGNGTPREKAAALKEIDRLRKVLLELDEYEHDVLYPLASQQVQIDLDDGVKANYPKLGAALKKIPGIEASDE
ncbi:BREX-1 system adenine-specific DNA-methyltransferase PglX [uncultured Arthrobacter sp.]|uniref:BREX-1 system adenine-specific DNA-methyltransferase PglX n=1 Tax=uncultured Arthrobacter sp. TaxID=114050 RepID=UPI0028D4725E|nr:BREX-1 system adenine-specific DNA-methyltransferase PglX [uncultured Arthrobacter sp.]